MSFLILSGHGILGAALGMDVIPFSALSPYLSSWEQALSSPAVLKISALPDPAKAHPNLCLVQPETVIKADFTMRCTQAPSPIAPTPPAPPCYPVQFPH